MDNFIAVLVLVGSCAAYMFGGTFTCGVLKAERDDAFWVWALWPAVLAALAVFAFFGVIGMAGHWVGRLVGKAMP